METMFTEKICWRSLEHTLLDGRYEIDEFLQQSGENAFFRVRAKDQAEVLLLRMEAAEQSGGAKTLARFREASFLSHPNLVRVIATGEALHEGQPIIYHITEMGDIDLAEAAKQQTLSSAEMSDLVMQLASGLSYLHEENLVYCALRAGSVWRVGNSWKLADFSQIRVPGKYPIGETRRMLVMPGFESPPEANEGSVLKTWDSWSLASMIRKLLLQPLLTQEIRAGSARSGSSSKIPIPAPYDRVLRESLEPDPNIRASLEDIVAIVSASRGKSLEEPARIVAPIDGKSELQPTFAKTTGTKEPNPPEQPRNAFANFARLNIRQIAIFSATLVLAALVLTSVFPKAPPLNSLNPSLKDQRPTRTEVPSTSFQPAAPVEEKRPSPFGTSFPQTEGDTTEEQSAISGVLKRWADATRNRDVAATISCYAPLVKKYYGQSNLSLQHLRTQQQDVYSRIGEVRKFQLTNVQFNRVTPQQVVVSFDKSWQFGNPPRFAGSAREEMVLQRVAGVWKISGQQERKVYWAHKSSFSPALSRR